MLSCMISRLVILLFGTLYPAFASYKAVKTKNIREYVKWMMYWIVFAIFTCLETVTDLFICWLPFYYEIKILLVVWLLSPATRGSSILYKKFVHPWLEKNEGGIERCLQRASEQSYSTVVGLGARGVNYATQVLMQTAIRGGGGLVEHLRRSYSVGDVAAADQLDFATDAGVRRPPLPLLVDVTEECGSDTEPVSAPAAVTTASRPRRTTRRQQPPAAGDGATTSKQRSRRTVRPASTGREPPTPPAWEQVQSLEDVSSGYNSGEPFYDAVNRDDEDAGYDDEEEEQARRAWAGRRAAPQRSSLRRPPLHAPASRRVKSSAQTDVSGYATLPRNSRRTAASRKPIPRFD